MEKFIIKGGRRLKGEVSVSGSKNVALKALVAACLTDEKVVIENIPLISDFMVMAEIIRDLGGTVTIKDHKAEIQVKKFKNNRIPLSKAAQIRTSSMFLAPLLARTNEAIVPNPGGCRIGARPIDRTIEGLKKMGVRISYNSKDGYFHAKTNNLLGTTYYFEKNTHTGTETLILSAVLAKGKTILENAAQEPEIDQLIEILNKMGARIKRVSTRTIVIDGVEKLRGATFRIKPDRNEIVTFAIAALITEGDVLVKRAQDADLLSFFKMFKKTGGGFEKKKDGIRFYSNRELKSTSVITLPHPGFMTDWQGPWAVLMTKANGESTIHETVYENRFSYVNELLRMGGNIEYFNLNVKDAKKTYNFNTKDDKKEYFHAIKIHGPTALHNAVINISDLRAGATLVLAALAAKGESVVFGVEHLDRGYEQFEQRLRILGAQIKRVVA